MPQDNITQPADPTAVAPVSTDTGAPSVTAPAVDTTNMASPAPVAPVSTDTGAPSVTEMPTPAVDAPVAQTEEAPVVETPTA